MSTIFDIATISAKVYVRSRDHCPPHVHITHAGEGWEARLAFSSRRLDSFAGFVPLARAPRLTVLNAAASAVAAKLPGCRAAWWRIHGKTCLDGQWLKIAENGIGLLAIRHGRLEPRK